MVRRLIRFIIIYAVIAIAASAVFIGVQRVFDRTYEPDTSDVFKDGEEPTGIVSLSRGFLAVLGRYTKGSNAGMLFCKIYNRKGTFISRHDFYIPDTLVEITGLINVDDGFRIVCLCTPWDSEQPGFGAVFGIDGHWKEDETVFFRAPDGFGNESGFDAFVCADNSGEYFAGISGRSAALYGAAGNLITGVSPDFFSVITDVAYADNSLLLTGTDAESVLGNNFRYGLAALYGIDGGEAVLKWQKSVMNDDGWCSAILNAEVSDNGFVLTGRMLNVGGNHWQSVNRIDSFRADNAPRRFQISSVPETTDTSSLFMLNMDLGGNITGSALYYTDSNEFIPAVMQYDCDSEYNPFILAVYSAETERSDRYSVNIMRLSRSLNMNESYSIPVSGDTVFMCAQDVTGAGFYACVYMSGTETYRILHFTSMDDAVNDMQTLLRLKPVRDYFFTLKKKAPVLIILAFAVMLTVSGAARVRRKRTKK